MGEEDHRDRLLRALSSKRRRYVLSFLDRLGTLTLADLADELAEQEHDASIDQIPAEDVKSLYMSLYHQHVPKLEEAGLVEYDQERDLVRPTERLPAIESTLDRILEDLSR